MKSVEFCYWLQGFFELANPSNLNTTQTDLIKRHLDMVFIHEIDQTYPEGQQKALNTVHNASKVESSLTAPIFPEQARC